MNSEIRQSVVKRLRRLFIALNRNLCFTEHAAASRDLEHTVLDLLTPLVASAEQESEDYSAWARRRQVVTQIIEYAQSHSDWVPSIPDLCNQFHLSRRSLQYAFEDVMGVSPTNYLRAIRLNGVRRTLRGVGAVSVQDAAAAWGFWNLSQFSADYRRFFGERPSDTLHNSDGIIPAARYPLLRH